MEGSLAQCHRLTWPQSWAKPPGTPPPATEAGQGAGRGAGQVLGGPGPSRSPSHRTSDQPAVQGYGGAGGLVGSGQAEVRRRRARSLSASCFYHRSSHERQLPPQNRSTKPTGFPSPVPLRPNDLSLGKGLPSGPQKWAHRGRMRLDPERTSPQGSIAAGGPTGSLSLDPSSLPRALHLCIY